MIEGGRSSDWGDLLSGRGGMGREDSTELPTESEGRPPTMTSRGSGVEGKYIRLGQETTNGI